MFSSKPAQNGWRQVASILLLVLLVPAACTSVIRAEVTAEGAAAVDSNVATCQLTFDDQIHNVYYNDADITSNLIFSHTGDLHVWNKKKEVTVNVVPDAYFVVTGREGNSDAFTNQCTSGGFAIWCDNGVNSSNDGWEVYMSGNKPDVSHLAGKGADWVTPGLSKSEFGLSEHPDVSKLCTRDGADSVFGSFRIRLARSLYVTGCEDNAYTGQYDPVPVGDQDDVWRKDVNHEIYRQDGKWQLGLSPAQAYATQTSASIAKVTEATYDKGCVVQTSSGYGAYAGSKSCHAGTANVSESNCLAAVRSILPAVPALDAVGSWADRPPGCSISGLNSGAAAAYYNNINLQHGHNAEYAPVCATLENTCKCSNGAPATGAACTSHGAEVCASCAAPHRLIGNLCRQLPFNCKPGYQTEHNQLERKTGTQEECEVQCWQEPTCVSYDFHSGHSSCMRSTTRANAPDGGALQNMSSIARAFYVYCEISAAAQAERTAEATPSPSPSPSPPLLWEKIGEGKKCTSGVPEQPNGMSQHDCQQRAANESYKYYSYVPGGDRPKKSRCEISNACSDGFEEGTSWPWKVFKDPAGTTASQRRRSTLL